MHPIIIKFRLDENAFIRSFTFRQYCVNVASYREALKISAHLLEKANDYNLRTYNQMVKDEVWREYKEMPFHVSFTLLYSSKEDAKNFLLYALEMLENYNI